MKLTYGYYTQCSRYIKCSGRVLSIGEAICKEEYLGSWEAPGTLNEQIVKYRDSDGFENGVNILCSNVKDVVIK